MTRATPTIHFATHNKNKFREAKRCLAAYNIELAWLNVTYPEIRSDSLAAIASHGVMDLPVSVSAQAKEAVMTEDAGLFVHALGGFPGPYSAYVMETLGCEGILMLLDKQKDRGAHFQSAIAYRAPGQKPKIFMGECQGTIASEIRGSAGFGFDPIFIPQGAEKTFAQMSIDKKGRHSHRGRALEKLGHYLASGVTPESEPTNTTSAI